MYQNMCKHGQINKTEIIPFIRANTDLSLLVVQHSQNILEHLSGAYDIHLKLRDNEWHLIFAINSSMDTSFCDCDGIDSSGYPKIKLESVV